MPTHGPDYIEKRDGCPLCQRGHIWESAHWRLIMDWRPVTLGHALLIPREHRDWMVSKDSSGLTTGELDDLGPALSAAIRTIAGLYGVDAMNVGINIGETAGQSIGHAHIHIMPRRIDDGGVGRGGVRRVFPERGGYTP